MRIEAAAGIGKFPSLVLMHKYCNGITKEVISVTASGSFFEGLHLFLEFRSNGFLLNFEIITGL